MSSFVYWPYDEVSLDLDPLKREAKVVSPWMEAKIALTEENKDRLQLLINKFKYQQLTAEDLGLVNWLFSGLDKYPFSYILPAPKDQSIQDAHSLLDESVKDVAPEEMIQLAVQDSDVSSVMENLARKDYRWDLETALSFSRVGEQVHPESIFSVARRYHLLELLENDSGKEAFRFIETLPKEDFAKAVALVVRQNHYVTQQCHVSLLPALEKAQSARPLVEHFIQQERGHDRILEASLKAIDEKYENIPVSSQTKALMALLKFAAARNFLAFAIAVDFFERNSYEKSDPLAQLLSKGGFDSAAKQINRHMEINDLGEHDHVACSFLSTMGPCDPAYATEAMRIAETISLVMNSVTKSALKIYLLSKQN